MKIPFVRAVRAAVAILSILCSALSYVVSAAPWVEVGERGLRSDIELLAAHGLIDGLTTTWPIPAGQFEPLLNLDSLAQLPPHVQHAVARVIAHVDGAPLRTWRPAAEARFATSENVVRGFGSTARSEIDLRGGVDWEANYLALSLRAGILSDRDGDDIRESLDGSYFNALWGNLHFYGGWAEQWYGAGWDSSLVLSNNARPFPKLGVMRNDPHEFDSRWLSWMGPVQVNFFIGLLDGPRTDKNTLLGSLRLAMAPFDGLEISISRVTQFCGANHSCRPVNVAFAFSNDDENPNDPNEQSTIEFKYLGKLGAISVGPYAQFMNEDTGPFAHATTSYLGGVSVAGPWGGHGAHWRMSSEFSDTVSTRNWFSFNKREYGIAYNNFGYTDGFRYRDRTLGFSLDSDSKLFSLGGNIVDARGWQYTLVYHNVRISTPQLAAMQATKGFIRNAVSAQPIRYDQIEIGLKLPYPRWTFELSVRGQEDQVYPDSGSDVAVEGGISFRY